MASEYDLQQFSPTTSSVDQLAVMVSGCRDSQQGIQAKQHLVNVFVAENSTDYLDVVIALHTMKVITIKPPQLFRVLSYRKPSSALAPPTAAEAAHAGYFLASVLASCNDASAMTGIVDAYVAQRPQVSSVDLVRYISAKGFVVYSPAKVAGAIDWKPPEDDDAGRIAPWRAAWGDGPIPEGKAWYASLRDDRGRRAHLCFLGSITNDGNAPALLPPSQVMIRQFKVAQPAMCITVDAGSMHPRQCDSIDRMAYLPQYYEWVHERSKKSGGVNDAQAASPPAKATGWSMAGRPGGSTDKVLPPAQSGASSPASSPDKKSPHRRLSALFQQSIDQWRDGKDAVKTEDLLGDASINNVIFTKVKEVFAALLDAATLAGSWIVVDRTGGNGSATAELLLEMALERGGPKPVILVIDSLERLGNSRDGAKSRRILKQLAELFSRSELEGTGKIVSQEPNGSEADFLFDYKYHPDDFQSAAAPEFDVKDELLPFEVLPDHQRKKQNNTCDPNRKWRYFYVDGLFRSGTHYVIKNNDADEFNVEEVGTQGFLYAHGDTRTYKRLRANIQQGKPIVMLHNSGGVVTAFSWLQRVMAFQRPPPDTTELSGPLRYLVSNLSAANWTLDFGMPEMLMMRSLAERSPMLFRKNVISVDILTQSEEEMLECITGCFAQAGGVPELGLGNAEVNVIFNAWMTHLTLCENARTFHRLSVVVQWLCWLLSIGATTAAVVASSFGSGVLAREFNLMGLVTPPDRRLSASVPACAPALPPFSPPLLPPPAEPPMAPPSLPPMAPPSLPPMAPPSLPPADPPPTFPPPDFPPALLDPELVNDHILVYLNYTVVILPIVLALLVTISSRMKWRDKWSVCIMCADTLASEIYKFRMQTCEYDQNKPPGKDEDGNDLPPLSQKEKSRKSRMLFVDRVQAFTSACYTELSQQTGLRRTRALKPRKKVSASARFAHRAAQEEKPDLAQWYKLKMHLEEHFHRTTWAFPQGVSFLNWISALRPYLSQKTMKEEMRSVIVSLREQRRITVRGLTPLSQGDSDRVRQTLAKNLGLPPSLFDGVQDELRVLQRTIIINLAEEEVKKAEVEAMRAEAAGTQSPAALEAGAAGAVPTLTVANKQSSDDDELMREILMEMQGLGKPKEDEGEKLMKLRKKHRKMMSEAKKGVDDDYLAGPLSVDTYVCYRVRPSIEMLERRAVMLSRRLTVIETIGVTFQSAGAVFAVFQYTEWVAVTVAIAAVTQAFIEFINLRDQVTSVNLALRDMNALTVFWDSLSIVRRRTPAVKMQVCETTEEAILSMVSAHTTAASNTISSVAKQLASQNAEEEAAEAAS